MGFLQAIKEIFAKKEVAEPEPLEISFKDLKSWLFEENSKAVEKVNAKLAELAELFEDEKKKVRNSIDALSNAKLKNPNIMQRAKDIMHGNREQYIQKVVRLIEKKEFPCFENALEFCRQFEGELEAFGKSTAKNYTVLQEFFRNESREIALSLQQFTKIINNIKDELGKSKIEERNRLIAETERIDRQKLRKKELKDKIKDAKKSIEALQSKKTGAEENLKMIKASPEFRDYKELLALKEKLKKKEKKSIGRISAFFSVIEPALKKFERTCLDDKPIAFYRDDISNALLADENFEILNILKKLKESLKLKKIELKDKKRKKIMQELEKLHPEMFKTSKKELAAIKVQLADVDKRINASEINEKLAKIIREVKATEQKIKVKIVEKEKMLEEFESINISSLISSLEKTCKEALKPEITIAP